tara:strand:- start:511 stop:954 length:444 start_codon:yes stop_codon:yes gene_type:complete
MIKKVILFSLILLMGLNSVHAKIIVKDEWARVTPSGSGSVYMTIENDGDQDDNLTSAISDEAEMTMIHQTVREENIAKMIHVMGGIDLPKGKRIKLEPGGYHLMLMGIEKNLTLNDRIRITLSFKNNENIEISPIIKIRPPKMHKHE